MDIKLCVVIAVCLVQVLGGPRDLAADNEHAQYAVVKFATETTVFRMRAYSLALEVNHTIKVINKQIIALMETLAVDPAKIDAVKTEMSMQGDTILENILEMMNYCQTLIDLLNDINIDIINNPSKLELYLYIMNSEMNNLNRAYAQSHDIIVLSIDIVKIRIEIAIEDRDEPEAQQIRGLVSEAENILAGEQSLIGSSKVRVDTTWVLARDALQTLVDQQESQHVNLSHD